MVVLMLCAAGGGIYSGGGRFFFGCRRCCCRLHLFFLLSAPPPTPPPPPSVETTSGSPLRANARSKHRSKRRTEHAPLCFFPSPSPKPLISSGHLHSLVAHLSSLSYLPPKLPPFLPFRALPTIRAWMGGSLSWDQMAAGHNISKIYNGAALRALAPGAGAPGVGIGAVKEGCTVSRSSAISFVFGVVIRVV